MKKFLKIRYLFLLLLLWLVLRASLNYSGFCWAEKRWLSDEEVMDNMIAVVNSERLPFSRWREFGVDETNRDEYKKYEGYKFLPYQSIKDFKQQNPDCCKLDGYPSVENLPQGDELIDFYFFARLIGVFGYSGVIDYVARHEKPDGNSDNRKIQVYPTATNCGEAIVGIAGFIQK
jgi:hypothetical protein